jgi:hypothetical protein
MRFWCFVKAQDAVEKQCAGSRTGASIDSCNTRNVNANDPTAYPQAAGAARKALQVPALGIMPAKAWRMYPRIYNNPEEAELGYA